MSFNLHKEMRDKRARFHMRIYVVKLNIRFVINNNELTCVLSMALLVSPLPFDIAGATTSVFDPEGIFNSSRLLS